ncbi:hypothetical protein GOBAR_AA10209 [Gossypium barbadense]|uniref:Uncharacterized protein n=1 Tax=Gossypium barbadense TaxID=3634 RepID=A0A2P5Y4F8_GOSBA|nr:hypothetical protein GOBAR_AA10209 [Gossypium barbadense]
MKGKLPKGDKYKFWVDDYLKRKFQVRRRKQQVIVVHGAWGLGEGLNRFPPLEPDVETWFLKFLILVAAFRLGVPLMKAGERPLNTILT